MLYARAGLELKDPFSRILMEPIDPGAPAEEASAQEPSDATVPAEMAEASAPVQAAPVSEVAQAPAPEPEPEAAEPVTLGQALPSQAKPVPA